jgi:hypothetical protein
VLAVIRCSASDHRLSIIGYTSRPAPKVGFCPPLGGAGRGIRIARPRRCSTASGMSLATEEEEGGLVFLKNCGDELRAQSSGSGFGFYFLCPEMDYCDRGQRGAAAVSVVHTSRLPRRLPDPTPRPRPHPTHMYTRAVALTLTNPPSTEQQATS